MPARPRRRRLAPFRRRRGTLLSDLPAFAVPAASIQVLDGPAAFRTRLLDAIRGARRRIVLVCLYLEDDDAGREVMEALYAARAAHPTLSVDVFVDGHRARRGRLGEGRSQGNAAMYRAFAERHGDGVRVWGVPVHNVELFGVLHLKGMIVDDTVLYSGASLNDVYLHRHGRYRLDRYHAIAHPPLAACMADLARVALRAGDAAVRLDRPDPPRFRDRQPQIRALRQALRRAHYAIEPAVPEPDAVAVTPLLGFGRKDNALNAAILDLLRSARERIVLLTPYFNLPRPVRAALGQALRRGCRIEILVGDRTANDFYIPPDQPFRKIGLLPYLYESNLRRFAAAHRRHLASGQLRLQVWRHDGHSFHLKGLRVDDRYHLLTGHNLNPRAWAMDLENGLLLDDPSGALAARHDAEWSRLCRHAIALRGPQDLPDARSYPAEASRLLRRIRRFRFHHLLNRLL